MPQQYLKKIEEKNIDDAPLGCSNSEASYWTSGYNSALENTNAKELLEALESTKVLNLHLYEEGTIGHRVYNKITNALKNTKS
jgi:hypothetical protein